MGGLLADRVTLVTGGGSGIGRAAAQLFAQEGARVVVADIAPDHAAETVDTIKAAGGNAIAVTVDVANPDQVAAMVEAAVRHFGRLDCAFNNAGVTGGTPGVHDWDDAMMDRALAINIKGTMLCMKFEISQMEKQSGGCIVNMASTAGLVGVGALAYTASKHAVVGMTRVIAARYAARNIRVNALCPGAVMTAMLETSFERDPEMGKQLMAAHPIGRVARPQEIAEAAAWLLSDKSSYVAGIPLAVDGGFTAI